MSCARSSTSLESWVPNDFIVKVDSDVLFAAGWLFPTVLGADADLTGQPVASMSTHTRRAVAGRPGRLLFPACGCAPPAAIGFLAGRRAGSGENFELRPCGASRRTAPSVSGPTTRA